MTFAPTADYSHKSVRDLSFDEIESISGGPAGAIILGGLAIAGAAILSEAAVGFVDGMIKGFQDAE